MPVLLDVGCIVVDNGAYMCMTAHPCSIITTKAHQHAATCKQVLDNMVRVSQAHANGACVSLGLHASDMAALTMRHGGDITVRLGAGGKERWEGKVVNSTRINPTVGRAGSPGS